jgi:hypothetical protein
MSICNRLKREKKGRILKHKNRRREKKSNIRSIKRYKRRHANVKRIRTGRSILRASSKIQSLVRVNVRR